MSPRRSPSHSRREASLSSDGYPAPSRALRSWDVLVVGGAAVGSDGLPVLDEAAFIRYAAALGAKPASDEKHEMGLLPQFQADQHGWEAMATKVAPAYQSLSPEEQRVATIYGGNYGEAGAVDFFGSRWGLPPAWSGHNSYFMWGPPAGGRGAVMIAVGTRVQRLEQRLTRSRMKSTRPDDPYAMPYGPHPDMHPARSEGAPGARLASKASLHLT